MQINRIIPFYFNSISQAIPLGCQRRRRRRTFWCSSPKRRIPSAGDKCLWRIYRLHMWIRSTQCSCWLAGWVAGYADKFWKRQMKRFLPLCDRSGQLQGEEEEDVENGIKSFILQNLNIVFAKHVLVIPVCACGFSSSSCSCWIRIWKPCKCGSGS